VHRLALLPAVVVLLALPACGTDGEVTVTAAAPAGTPAAPSEIAGDADAADVEVIDNWARTLTAGDLDGAARLFATPSVAQNAGPALEISDFDDARLFNASLPCGAELIGAEREGDFTIATFVLRERPGHGTCGDGTGQTALTAFVIVDGRIVEWRRVVESGTRAPRRAT
jgi:limonene-1,2-epoxide hydrolase